MKTIRVKILENEYPVRSDGDLDQVRAVEQYLNEKIKEVLEGSEGLSEKKTAILAALYIASDYVLLKREHDALLSQVRARTDALIQQIDDTMP